MTPNLTREDECGSWLHTPAAEHRRKSCGNLSTGVAFASSTAVGCCARSGLLGYDGARSALQYQVMNLRMLLQRSLSDRVFTNDVRLSEGPTLRFTSPRAQAVLGFGVTTTPSHGHKGKVAEVEVTVTTDPKRSSSGRQDPPSLIAMLPRENTYNVASVTNDTKSIGLGALVKIVNLGVSTSKTSQTLYLLKDADTVALRRSHPCTVCQGDAQQVSGTNSLTFAWQFRPVLGQPAVQTAMRQVYALLALPAGPLDSFAGTIRIHTHWRDFSPKSKTVGKVVPGSGTDQGPYDFQVPELARLEEWLEPLVTRVQWTDTGSGQILVTLDGHNFLPGTSVVAGNAILDRPENGLAIQSENHLRFVAPAQSLLTANPMIVGPYGSSKEILLPAAEAGVEIGPVDGEGNMGPNRNLQLGFRIVPPVKLQSQDAENTRITLNLGSRQPDQGAPRGIDRPIVYIGDERFGLGNRPITITRSASTVDLVFTAPTSLLKANRRLVALEPFKGGSYRDEILIDFPPVFSATEVKVLSGDKDSKTLLISGGNIDADQVRVLVGDTEFSAKGARQLTVDPSGTQIIIRPTNRELAGVDVIRVLQGKERQRLLELPPGPLPKPQLGKHSPIRKNESATVRIPGENVQSIAQVYFQRRRLDFRFVEAGRAVELFVPRAVTRFEGAAALRLVLKDGSAESYTLTVAP